MTSPRKKNCKRIFLYFKINTKNPQYLDYPAPFGTFSSNSKPEKVSGTEHLSNTTVNQVMRSVLLYLFFSPFFSLSQTNNDSISKNGNSGLTEIDQLIDFSIEIQELAWFDSTVVKFLTITHIDDQYNLKHINANLSDEYRNLGGPIIVGHVYVDSCLLHPILTKGNTSFFLLDDFKHITARRIPLSIVASVGRYNQNQERLFYEFPSLELSEITLILDSMVVNSNDILATKEWYETWFRDRPNFRQQRTRNAHEHCK